VQGINRKLQPIIHVLFENISHVLSMNIVYYRHG